MSRRKTERLFNLVICLLATRRYLSAEQIRHAVPGYAESDDAFRRMFERDKEELRELGIPLETGTDSVWDDEPGYRIRRASYELPEISLEPDEAAVLGLAARVWQRASLAGPASDALLKLRAAGIETTEAAPSGIEPRVATEEPAFPALWRAVRDRQPVTFDYRNPNADAPRRRHVEPWGVVSWHGHWYLVGHDNDREAVRVFRLGRITSDVQRASRPGSVIVPEGVNIRDIVVSGSDHPWTRTARIRVRQGAGHGIRQNARSCIPGSDGWDDLDVAFSDVRRLASWIGGFGGDAVVVSPPEARDAIVSLLSNVAEVGA